MKHEDDRNLDEGASASDPLRDDLRRQAMAERPAFSGELHRRIMQQIRNESSQEAQHRASPAARRERSLGARECDPSPLYSGERQSDGLLGATESSPIRRWRLPAAIAALLLVAVTITAAWLLMGPHSAKPLAPLVQQDVQPEPAYALTKGDSPLYIKGAVPFSSNDAALPIKPAPALARFTSDFSGLFSQTRQPKLILKLPIVGDLSARLPEPQALSPAPPGNANSADWLAQGLHKPMTRATAALDEMIPPEVKVLIAMARTQTP